MSPSPDPFTHVELTWIEKRIEHWIRFGHDFSEKILDRRRRWRTSSTSAAICPRACPS